MSRWGKSWVTSIGGRQPIIYRRQCPHQLLSRHCWFRGCNEGTARSKTRRQSAPRDERGVSLGACSVSVWLAAAGPDQSVGVGIFVVEEVGVDRSVEARIVQLD